MREKHNTRGVLSMVIGALLVLAGMGLTGYNMYDDARAGRESYEIVQILAEDLQPELLHPASSLETEEEILVEDNRTLPVKNVHGRQYVGLLQIPKLNLELPVQTPWSLDNLAVTPCLYAGDPYHNNLVICAHNFDSHFGQIKTLEEGDEVLFVAMDAEVFHYKLSAQDVLTPTSVKEMTEGADWDMTLFTCTLGGEYRVTVRFVRQQDLQK